MKELIELFKLFQGAGLLLTSFIMGTIAMFMAIIGKTDSKGFSLTSHRSILLAVFGGGLMLFAISGYLISLKTSSPPAVYTTRSEMNTLFGNGNWFCFPDREDGVGVKRLPPGFTVGPLLRHVDTYLGQYGPGQTAPAVGATVELRNPLPQTDCPSHQLAALATWQT